MALAAAVGWASGGGVEAGDEARAETKPSPSFLKSDILWRGGFETGDLSEWTAVQAVEGGVAIVPSPVRKGHYAARFVVRPGDHPTRSRSERAEILFKTGEVEGTESWWAWSTYFPSEFEPSPDTTFNVFTQWHQTYPKCAPVSAFFIDTKEHPAVIGVWARGGPLGHRCRSPYRRFWTLARFEKDRWYDFVFHVKWSADPGVGFYEIWLNGDLVLPKTHTATLYAGLGAYLKQGYYRRPSSSTAVVYHDGTRRARAAVIPAAG